MEVSDILPRSNIIGQEDDDDDLPITRRYNKNPPIYLIVGDASRVKHCFEV